MSRILALCLVSAVLGSGPADASSDATKRFHDLLAEDWEFRLAEDPLFATEYGDHRADDRLPSEGLADHRRRSEHDRRMIEAFRAVDPGALDARDRVSYEIFLRLKQDSLGEYGHKTHLMPITNRSGFHVSFPQLPKRVPLDDVADYEAYISRLGEYRRYTAQHIELMRAGIEQGYVLPGIVLQGWEGAVDPHIVEDPEDSLLFEPLRELPETLDDAAVKRLVNEARRAIAESVVPGYRAFREFMAEEYVPAARAEVAAAALPDGKAFYEHRVRRYTTLDLTPDQVHQKGLDEVARIKTEMLEIIAGLEFEGSFTEFVEFLRTDPRFYVGTPEELLGEVSRVMKRMDGELPRLFKTLPRMPYGIRPVPDYIAPKTTTAYYERPAGDGTRAGFYYVNTHNLKSRPLYEVETLSLHEAVPGHHLQIALQQELEKLPEFRRFSGFTAFVEGWALYAERLGREVGFYEDPYSMFGHLTYEMWRACRLVVDTGLHYKGWTREQAIELMAENTALSRHNITTEVDRYISWPGQALAYKTGELKIRELRALAQEALGPAFDVREFHDVVLLGGSVPLDVLERQVRAYIAGRAAE